MALIFREQAMEMPKRLGSSVVGARLCPAADPLRSNQAAPAESGGCGVGVDTGSGDSGAEESDGLLRVGPLVCAPESPMRRSLTR